MKILIVDDSKTMRMIVRRTLRQAGFGSHKIVEATDGKEALEMIEEEEPDLVLSDWHMPNMTGIECLRAAREAGHTIPFGFVTTEGNTDLRSEATQAGANFLIAKPFTSESFEDALTPFLD